METFPSLWMVIHMNTQYPQIRRQLMKRVFDPRHPTTLTAISLTSTVPAPLPTTPSTTTTRIGMREHERLYRLYQQHSHDLGIRTHHLEEDLSLKVIQKRRQLRYHPEVRKALEEVWLCLPKLSNNTNAFITMTPYVYCTFEAVLLHSLVPKVSGDQCKMIVTDNCKHAMGGGGGGSGGGVIGKDRFLDILFDITEVWCDDDVGEFIAFIRTVALTVAKELSGLAVDGDLSSLSFQNPEASSPKQTRSSGVRELENTVGISALMITPTRSQQPGMSVLSPKVVPPPPSSVVIPSYQTVPPAKPISTPKSRSLFQMKEKKTAPLDNGQQEDIVAPAPMPKSILRPSSITPFDGHKNEPTITPPPPPSTQVTPPMSANHNISADLSSLLQHPSNLTRPSIPTDETQHTTLVGGNTPRASVSVSQLMRNDPTPSDFGEGEPGVGMMYSVSEQHPGVQSTSQVEGSKMETSNGSREPVLETQQEKEPMKKTPDMQNEAHVVTKREEEKENTTTESQSEQHIEIADHKEEVKTWWHIQREIKPPTSPNSNTQAAAAVPGKSGKALKWVGKRIPMIFIMDLREVQEKKKTEVVQEDERKDPIPTHSPDPISIEINGQNTTQTEEVHEETEQQQQQPHVDPSSTVDTAVSLSSSDKTPPQ
eukprot:PhF_6_TR31878/c0_g1_i1/m.47365